MHVNEMKSRAIASDAVQYYYDFATRTIKGFSTGRNLNKEAGLKFR